MLEDGARLPEGQEVTVLAPGSGGGGVSAMKVAPGHSVLDIPPVSLAAVLEQGVEENLALVVNHPSVRIRDRRRRGALRRAWDGTQSLAHCAEREAASGKA